MLRLPGELLRGRECLLAEPLLLRGSRLLRAVRCGARAELAKNTRGPRSNATPPTNQPAAMATKPAICVSVNIDNTLQVSVDALSELDAHCSTTLPSCPNNARIWRTTLMSRFTPPETAQPPTARTAVRFGDAHPRGPFLRPRRLPRQHPLVRLIRRSWVGRLHGAELAARPGRAPAVAGRENRNATAFDWRRGDRR